MKKEIYITPQIEVVEMEVAEMLATSGYSLNNEEGDGAILSKQRDNFWE